MLNSQFRKAVLGLSLTGTILLASGCGSSSTSANATNSSNSDEPLKVAFYPNESATEFEAARDEIQKTLSDATSREVEIVTTTDYNVVVESIANGQVDMAYMGAEGYIEANKKNDKVQAIFTNSGASGTLDDAIYYSYIAVKEENSGDYQDGSDYSLENIEGKSFSFVSNSSTSGFKVPSSSIVKEFGLESADELLIDGDFFERVLFGGSHQGSAVNLLNGDADAAAFMNMPQYFEVVEGEESQAGMLYQVKEDAEAPFDSLRGEQARIIQTTPVLNGPIVANTETLDEETVDKIVEAMTSDEVAENTAIFAPEGETGFYEKKGEDRYVEVTDEWYNPIREL
ncbi:phosphate/phosphite/phosphonate ABC transporter substrate-binding protein [Enterococcus sp. LJL90]